MPGAMRPVSSPAMAASAVRAWKRHCAGCVSRTRAGGQRSGTGRSNSCPIGDHHRSGEPPCAVAPCVIAPVRRPAAGALRHGRGSTLGGRDQQYHRPRPRPQHRLHFRHHHFRARHESGHRGARRRRQFRRQRRRHSRRPGWKPRCGPCAAVCRKPAKPPTRYLPKPFSPCEEGLRLAAGAGPLRSRQRDGGPAPETRRAWAGPCAARGQPATLGRSRGQAAAGLPRTPGPRDRGRVARRPARQRHGPGPWPAAHRAEPQVPGRSHRRQRRRQTGRVHGTERRELLATLLHDPRLRSRAPVVGGGKTRDPPLHARKKPSAGSPSPPIAAGRAGAASRSPTTRACSISPAGRSAPASAGGARRTMDSYCAARTSTS